MDHTVAWHVRSRCSCELGRRAALAPPMPVADALRKARALRLPHLRQRARAVVLDLVVPQVQLPQALALGGAQAAADEDGAVVAERVAAQVELFWGCFYVCGERGFVCLV